ncbi:MULTISPECIES: hypothetical protein [Pseudomonas]|uniref:hypothetical protein n=1 Tax=Pseudomonas TaxID=286 RepID=UPI0009EEEA88|nr:hypothetical protein [Pseudomonas putida]GLO43840.1 hypothetical protein PPUN109347_04020 [Pseudomonas putida]HDS0980880.1 hypothetical protein [Pseudomonas putida]
MNKQTFAEYLQQEINKAAQDIVNRSDNVDYFAHGKLSYLLSLRRITSGNAVREDFGRHDGINDVLQLLGIIPPDRTYISYIPK